ncbi:response regulator transcription factor [Streptomyces sp. NPDC057908]|uniref:response regulator transcription factor n=1 Tax=Streptomyces sp. NPDC057908 TaxID=3346276 RepID=UPI0036E2C655
MDARTGPALQGARRSPVDEEEPAMPDALNTVVCEPTLTPRERQVLTLLAGGETYWGIGRRLGISPHTVDTHLRRLRDKTGTSNRTQLVVLAIQRGYLT